MTAEVGEPTDGRYLGIDWQGRCRDRDIK